MGMFGFRTWGRIGLRTAMDVGPGSTTTVGVGLATIRGAGRRITMAAGTGRTTVGPGIRALDMRATTGAPHSSPFSESAAAESVLDLAAASATWAGYRWPRLSRTTAGTD